MLAWSVVGVARQRVVGHRDDPDLPAGGALPMPGDVLTVAETFVRGYIRTPVRVRELLFSDVSGGATGFAAEMHGSDSGVSSRGRRNLASKEPWVAPPT